MNDSLGKEILKLRKKIGLTQKTLCDGICTQPTISMIEKGLLIPNIDILSKLSVRLNKPLEYFTDNMFFNNYNHINQFVNDIEELTLSQKFTKVYNLVKKELQNPKSDKWFEVFLQWQLNISAYYLNFIKVDQAITELKKLIKATPKIILRKNFLDIRVLNSIALLLAQEGNYEQALVYFNKVSELTVPSVSPRLNEQVYLLRVFYNRTKTLYDIKNFSDAINSCLQGIEYSKSLENMSLLGNFYYYLGQCYEQLNYDPKDITIAYQNSLFFFKHLDRDLYIKILEKEKSIFL